MPKQIRQNEDINIAPDILGVYRENQYFAFDQRNNILLDPLNIDHKIMIYERQVKEWFLNRASYYLRGKKNGFVVLMICMSYFEGVEELRNLDANITSSNQLFQQSIKRLYPEFNSSNITKLYNEARSGLFHLGMTRKRIIINNSYDSSIWFENRNNIKINPRKLLIDIKKDFKKYIRDLNNRNNMALREKFDLKFMFLQISFISMVVSVMRYVLTTPTRQKSR